MKETNNVHNLGDIFSSKQNFTATVKQFIKFGYVGLMNAGISYFLYFLCIYNGMSIYAGNAIGFVGGVVNSYLWNSRWVFKGNQEGFKKTIPKFFATYLLSLVLSMLLLYLFVDMGGMNKYAAPILIICITTFIKFSLSKFWTFKN